MLTQASEYETNWYDYRGRSRFFPFQAVNQSEAKFRGKRKPSWFQSRSVVRPQTTDHRPQDRWYELRSGGNNPVCYTTNQDRLWYLIKLDWENSEKQKLLNTVQCTGYLRCKDVVLCSSSCITLYARHHLNFPVCLFFYKSFSSSESMNRKAEENVIQVHRG